MDSNDKQINTVDPEHPNFVISLPSPGQTNKLLIAENEPALEVRVKFISLLYPALIYPREIIFEYYPGIKVNP